MRSVATFFSVCAAALLLACASPALALPKAGQQVPGFKVVTTTGQPVTQDTYRGNVLILDFFATWCGPCKISIPHLADMYRKYGKQGLQVLGMSVDEDGEKQVKEFAAEYHMNYPVALAGDTVMGSFGIRSVPIMFLVDKKGKLIEVFRGFNDQIGQSLETQIKRLLAEK